MSRMLRRTASGGQGSGRRAFWDVDAMLPRQSLIPVGLFAALLLIISLHALAASGHFPHRHGSPASGIGSLVLYGSTAVVLACLMIGLALAWWLVPWYAAVIAGGLSVLAAPVVLQQFPDTF